MIGKAGQRAPPFISSKYGKIMQKYKIISFNMFSKTVKIAINVIFYQYG